MVEKLNPEKMVLIDHMGSWLKTGTVVAIPPALAPKPHNSVSDFMSLGPWSCIGFPAAFLSRLVGWNSCLILQLDVTLSPGVLGYGAQHGAETPRP